MKAGKREAEAYFARPDPRRAGVLLYGPDGMRVALRRQQVIAALIGPKGEEEMRLTRLSAAELRSEPALLLEAMRAIGFFPGLRVIHIEGAGEGTAAALEAALGDWREGDALLVVSAGALKAGSKLRKLFEGHRNALAIGLYDDPPSRAELERAIAAAGLTSLAPDAFEALAGLAATLGPGDFAQTLEKIALYKLGDDTPLTPEDIALSAPAGSDVAMDDLLNAVAGGDSGRIGPLLARMEAQGTNATTLCIGAARHFRQLYTLASATGGIGAALQRMRPPVFGARRENFERQLRLWSPERLEAALCELTDTDLALRSAGQTAPAMAVVSRTLIRLATMARARR